MKWIIGIKPCALMVLLIPWTEGRAQAVKQHAVVIADHRGGDGTFRFRSEVDSKVTRGGLRQVRVPAGESACFIVERANTLLFGYSLNPEALKGQVSAEGADVVASLTAALTASTPAPKQSAEPTKAALNANVALPQLNALFRQLSSEDALTSMKFRDGLSDSIELAVRRDTRQPNANTLALGRVITTLLIAANNADDEETKASNYSAEIKRLATFVADMEALRKASAADTNLSYTVAKSSPCSSLTGVG
jgi:hypothetical protein